MRGLSPRFVFAERTPHPSAMLRIAATLSHKAERGRATSRNSAQVRRIYKICPASAWREAERQGVYRGSADDVRDGFIHFSTASQVAETARKHFFGQTGLFLIEVDADALGRGAALGALAQR